MKSGSKNLCLFLMVVLISLSAFAQNVAVSLKDNKSVASDLEYDGALLSEGDAFKLKKDKFDLSVLNPDQTTDYWKLSQVKQKIPVTELIDSRNPPELEYINPVSSEIGSVRLAVQSKGLDSKNFVIQFSRNNHKTLMRKALLEKLGFSVPAVQWISEITLTMDSSLVDDFKDNMKIWAGEPKSWIKSTRKGVLVLKDVLLFESVLTQYHLATGYIPGAVKKTRLFNSLPIAFGLLEYPEEGLDQFAWTYGQVSQDLLITDFPQNISGYAPNVDDARWMARLIAGLSRSDFADIVAASDFPEAVQNYLLEKIIARRNSLLTRLSMDEGPLDYDRTVTVNGFSDRKKNKKEDAKIDGFADTFVSKNDQGPLSAKQLIPYGEALLQSAILNAAVEQFNNRIMPGTNLTQKIYDQQFSAFIKQLKTFIDTGEKKEIPFGAYVIPYLNAHLIMSRDVVTGSYMGSSSMVQKADSFGFSVNAGTFVGFNGLPEGVFANGRGQIFFNRIYTHLRPMQDIQSVFKEPFRNIYVDSKREKVLKLFKTVMGTPTSDDLRKLKDQINLVFPVGDSLIMTDTMGSSIAGMIGKGFNQNISASLSAQVSGRIIRRIHMSRSGENAMQIYVDDGKIGDFNISIDLNAVIPVINMSHSNSRAAVSVSLHKLNLDPERNPEDAGGEYKTFFHILKDGNMSGEVSRPALQTLSRIKNSEDHFKLLPFSIGSQRTRYDLKVEAPNAPARSLLRLKKSNFSDWDWLGQGQNVANTAIERLLKINYQVNIPESPTAGETLFGQSKIFDGYLDAVVGESETGLDQLFYSSRRLLKEWKIQKKNILHHIDRMNKKAGVKIFDPADLNGVDEIQFYTLSFQTLIYENGIKKLATLDDKTLDAIFSKVENLSPEYQMAEPDRLDSIKQKILGHLKKYRSLGLKKNSKAPEELLMALIVLDKSLTTKGLLSLIGEANMALMPSINGFKTGDMNGMQIIRGEVLGRIPKIAPYGPIANIIQNTAVLDSEMLSFWLVRGFQ